MFPRFTRVVACVGPSFLFVAEKGSAAWMGQRVFTRSSTDGHLLWLALQ